MNRDYYAGMTQGRLQERERIVTRLWDYFELTCLPSDNGVEKNPEWDAGFQAAISLIKEEQK